MTKPLTTNDETRHELLATAARLFTERGYDGTRIKEISDAAGISKASLYNHFRSKSSILFELQLVGWQEQIAAAEEALEDAGDDDRAAIERFAAAHIEALLGRPLSIGLTVVETRDFSADQHAEIAELQSRYTRLVSGLIRRGRTGGLLREDLEEKELRLAFTTLLNGSLIGHSPDDEERVAQLAEVAGPLFLDGLRQRHPSTSNGETRRDRPPYAFDVPDVLNENESPASARSDEILDAAILQFWEKGYAPTTTRDLSRALGLANSSLYHHIAEKEQLLFAAYQRGYRNLYTILGDTFNSPEGDELALLELFLSRHTESMLRDSQRSSMMVNGVRYLGPHRLESVVGLRERIRSIVATIIEDAQEQQMARTDLPLTAVSQFLRGGCQWATQWYEPEGPWPADRIARTLADVWVEGAARRPL